MAELFPAYAGVILRMYGYFVKLTPFPRLRGGDPSTKRQLRSPNLFSPPTRG